jgi:hypothetical protein
MKDPAGRYERRRERARADVQEYVKLDSFHSKLRRRRKN